MGDWIRWAPDYLRDADLTVHVVDGFDTRTRSSSPDGLDSILGLVVHHTVSNFTDPADEADFLANRHSVAPVGNLFLDRHGEWWCCAAGATNTNGQGGPRIVSQGVIPEDNGNRTCPAIEAANNGVGEAWPDVQLDSYVRGCAALLRGSGPKPGGISNRRRVLTLRVGTDPESGPGRAVPVRAGWRTVASPHPRRRCVRDGHVRGEVFAVLLPPKPPPTGPPPEDFAAVFICKDESTTYWIGNGFTRRRLRDDKEVDRWVRRRLRGFVAGQVVKDRETVPEVLPRALVDLGRDVTEQFMAE